MKCLILLILYHTAYCRSLWPQFTWNTQDEASNNDLDDMVSGLLTDFNLDISFPLLYESLSNNNDYVDRSPSSIFESKGSQPLYLTMQSPQTGTSSTYTLTKTDKVNGDTWRYTMNANGNHQTMKESYQHKLYLCDRVMCSNDNGMEMRNIFNEFIDDEYTQYMHLVPTSTINMESDDDDDADVAIDWNKWMNMASDWWNNNKMSFVNDEKPANNESVSWVDTVFDIANTWLDSYKKQLNNENIDTKQDVSDETMDSNPVDSDVDNEEKWNSNIGDRGFVGNNDRELADETEDAEDTLHTNNLVLVEMTIIMIFIMICGVIYAGWRYMVDRREKQRELNYYNIKVTNVNDR